MFTYLARGLGPAYHKNLLIVKMRPTATPALAMAVGPLASPGLSALAAYERAGLIQRVIPLDQPAPAVPAALTFLEAMTVPAHPATSAAARVSAGVRILELQPGTDPLQLQTALAQDIHVESVSRVPVRYLLARARTSHGAAAAAAAAVPPADSLWNLKKIKWSQAREAGLNTAAEVRVAVLDTGIDLHHPDLPGAEITYVHSYPGATASDRDLVGHGTHVSGTIRALINNGLGINGICDCRLSMYKIFGDTAEYFDEIGYYSYFVDPVLYRKALAACLDANVQVINLSIGGGGAPDPQERTLFQELVSAGTVVVAAMGNEASSQPSYPAAIPGVIAVGATSLDDSLADFSNIGDHIALCAPGVGIWSTLPTYAGQIGFRPVFGGDGSVQPGTRIARETDYAAWDGTSMATPHVAAAAALALHAHGTMTPAAMKDLLGQAADKVPGMGGAAFTSSYGSGRLNLSNLASP